MDYFYLHGFASSPKSSKAQDFGDRFSKLNRQLIIPDLNQDDFSHLTISRQIQQVSALFPSPEHPVTLIGSSLGGLTAAHLAQRFPQVQQLILLAPAFGFLDHWLDRLGEMAVKQWQESGYLKVYHYRDQASVPLHYAFVTDAEQYRENLLTRAVPTLIFHGIQDEVIPVSASRTYSQLRPWVRFIELDSDHALTDVSEEIWRSLESIL